MNKTIKSLAVLATILTAAAFTSCNKAEVEPISSDKVVTVTINPPTNEDTKLATTDNGSRLSITGWALGDIVTLVKTNGYGNPVTVSNFECVDAARGTFRGTLPDGVSDVGKFGYALYNTFESTDLNYGAEGLSVYFKNKVSTDIKDVIVMYAKNNGGAYQMSVANNILQVDNKCGVEIEVAVKMGTNLLAKYGMKIQTDGLKTAYGTGSFENCKFILQTGLSFVSLPPNPQGVYSFGLCLSSDIGVNASVATENNIAEAGKIYTTSFDAIPGLFSVAADKKVYFSKGNLYWDGAFKFENHQYSFATKWDEVMNEWRWDADHVSHFYWSQTASSTYGKYYPAETVSLSDVLFTNDPDNPTKPNSNFTVNGVKGAWRTLTGGPEGEWKWLMENRISSTIGGVDDARYAKATVNGVPGMILFPDIFVRPTSISIGTSANDIVPASINVADATFAAMTFDTAHWSCLESVGCVFLPAAGYRIDDEFCNLNECGFYWSSSPDEERSAYAHYLCFGYTISISYVYANSQDLRRYACCVRLVRDQ